MSGQVYYERENKVTDAPRERGSGDRREFGRVKWVNKDRGYFFIIPDWPCPALEGRDCFGHISQVRGQALINLDKDVRVSFVLQRSKKSGNFEAHDVRIEKGK